jgi:ribosome biogenesis ATPase
VRKIVDDQAENDKVHLSVPVIYDTIKRSNSSLNRKPKRILEDSIERVVEVIKSEEGEDESIDGDFEGLEEQQQPPATV